MNILRNPAHEQALSLNDVVYGREFVVVKAGQLVVRGTFLKDYDRLMKDKDGWLPIIAASPADELLLVFPCDDGLICSPDGVWAPDTYVLGTESVDQP